MRFTVPSLALLLSAGFAHAQAKPTAEAVEFFEKHVRPVFAEHCYSCHGEKKQQGGLRLDKKAAFVKGSDSGPAVVPGDPENSLLVKSVRHEGENKMPPKMKLPQPAIDAIAAWVKAGAAFPDDAPEVAVDLAKTHWAFQPVKDPAPPAPKAAKALPLDRFTQIKLEAAGGSLSPLADKRTLVRRATHDLTGLPPTPEETDRFVTDPAPNAYEQLIDRLLDSPHYGEHQARNWMDVARYADTKGYVFQEDRNYPYAYTYRDWLIRAFNDDLPYDQFIVHQLAADRVVKDDKRPLAAMGFLTVGRRFLNSQPDIIDDRLDVTFRGFQGLTVVCARCHDHKYDPIPTKDYYSLYGVFASSVEPKDLPLVEAPKDTPEVKAFEAESKKREAAVAEATATLRAGYLTKLKTAPVIAEYLKAVRDVKGMKPADMGTVAADRKLFAVALTSWQTYLDGRKANEAVFGVYKALAAIPDAEFAAKAPAQLATLLKETDPKKLNPMVKEAFAGKKPATFADVCAVYGEVLAKNQTPPEGETTTAQVELLAVFGPPGPFAFEDQQFRRLLTVAEQNKIRDLKRKADEWKAKSPVAPARAMVMNDGPKTEPVVFVRGNAGNRGPQVPRQFLGLLAPDRKPFADGSGRLEMAKAIADPNNPLTARVMANRVWAHLFGQGLVRTPSDFGVRSDLPTHPELLDWLAKRFVEAGWSVKKFHRLVMLSETYRQSAAVTPEMAKADPENRRLGRMSRKRMTFEGMRDATLLAAGQLDETVGGKSVDLFKTPATPRRAVYGFVDRQNLPGTLRSFDFASPDAHSPQRFVTTVPQQALFLMNSPFVVEQAKAMAKRVEATEPGERIAELYRLALGRPPTADELAAAKAFVAPDSPGPPDLWAYGWGAVDAKQKVTFAKLPQFVRGAYQGGPTTPDATLGWCILHAAGGHAGNDQAHAVIRRWVAPQDGTVAVSGTLTHVAKEGDGVRGRIVSGRTGLAGEWLVNGKAAETPVAKLEVKAGDTLDFVTDCVTNPGHDSFAWPVTVTLTAGARPQVFDAAKDFAAPKDPKPAVGPWEQLAQVLLLSNEFAFVE